MLSFEDPFHFQDSRGDNYKFHIFRARDGSSHFAIGVEYKNPAMTSKIFGYTVLGYNFAQPLINGKIDWYAHSKEDGSLRNKSISFEAKKMANRLARIRVFI